MSGSGNNFCQKTKHSKKKHLMKYIHYSFVYGEKDYRLMLKDGLSKGHNLLLQYDPVICDTNLNTKDTHTKSPLKKGCLV